MLFMPKPGEWICRAGWDRFKRNTVCAGPKCERIWNALETKKSVTGVMIAKQRVIQSFSAGTLLLCGRALSWGVVEYLAASLASSTGFQWHLPFPWVEKAKNVSRHCQRSQEWAGMVPNHPDKRTAGVTWGWNGKNTRETDSAIFCYYLSMS